MTALAALPGGVTAARAGRRPGRGLARNVGLGLGLLGLLYLGLWWRSHLLGAPLLAQATALLLGLGLSVVLGRFGSLAAVAVLSAGGVAEGLPPASLSVSTCSPSWSGPPSSMGGAWPPPLTSAARTFPPARTTQSCPRA